MRRFVSLLLLVVACSSSAGDPIDRLTSDYAAAACEWHQRCCAENEREFSGEAECRAQVTELFGWEREKEAVEAGLATYRPERAERCLQKIASSCAPDLLDVLVYDPCGQLFVGQGGVGAACYFDLECGDGLVCEFGECGTRPGLGQACDTRCAGDLYCRDSMCIRRLATGERCTNFWDCASDDCVEGVCVEPEPFCDGR